MEATNDGSQPPAIYCTVKQYSDGGVYGGEWLNGVRHGMGHYKYPDGATFYGKFEHGKRTHGVLTYVDGATYEGQFLRRNDLRHGIGTFKDKDGCTYEGKWLRDLQNGYGVSTDPNGQKYSGFWIDGVFHGTGTLVRDGHEYRGTWAYGLQQGWGIHKFPNNDKYEGEFSQGNRSGYGVHMFSNGGQYEGEWLNDARHGKGVQQLPSGGKYRGEWRNGKMEGHGILQSLDCVYVGDLCRNVRQGIGTMQHINGGKYSGQWHNDKRHGKGTTVEANGTVIEGQWKAGWMFGKCTISKRGGERVTVYCIDGGATVRYDKCIEAVTVVQKYIRQVFAQREERRLRAEAAATTLSPEETLKQQLELLAKREKRLGVVTKTKPKAAPSVRAPARAAKSRRGGGNTRDKRTPRASRSPALDDAPVPWSEQVATGDLKRQMDRAKVQRRTAANAAAAPRAPDCFDTIDLHKCKNVDDAKDALCNRVIACLKSKARTKSHNHLTVVTGKGLHSPKGGERLKTGVREILDAWGSSYSVKVAEDGRGWDGFYVKVTRKLCKHARDVRDNQSAPRRPGVTLCERR